MSLLNTLRTALQGIASNKLRSALTMLGIIIGVASVIAMLALGNGARQEVESSFRFLGSDEIQIGMERTLEDGDFQPKGKLLSYADGLDMVENVPLVERVEMRVVGYGKTRHGRYVADVTASGTMADALPGMAQSNEVQPIGWPEEQPLNTEAFLANGRFYTPAEVTAGAEVCVLAHKTALDLFAGDDPVGESIWLNRRRCQVIGVLRELESTNPANRFGDTNINEGLYMPISTAVAQLFEDEPEVLITAHVRDESQMETAKEQVNKYLRERHDIAPDAEGNYDDDFFMTTRQDVLGARLEAARTFSLLLAAMAAVSLVVGGIGIMNVMLVSVTERTREIGVRMAVGARRRDLILHFLLEAMLISALGGLLGVAVGILLIPLIAELNGSTAVLQPGSIPLAFGVALLTGVVFGLYPAVRAAYLNPMEALRYE
jgi:ABC-type antimicrobial peptide transport system permease subunit